MGNSFEQILLNEVFEDIKNNDMAVALEKLKLYDENTHSIFEDGDYYSFDNPMEFELFKEYVGEEIEFVPGDIPVKHIYYIYGFLLLEANRPEDARDMLLKSLKFDPVSPFILFELMEAYKRLNDFDSYMKCLDDIFTFAYTPEDLARAYRALGFYKVDIREWDFAVAAYVFSLKYENSEVAYQELDFIKNSGHDIEMDFKDAVKILRDNNVSLVANDFVVSKFRQWGDEFAEEESFKEAFDMYACAYAIDDSFENQMRYRMAESILNGNGNAEISL